MTHLIPPIKKQSSDFKKKFLIISDFDNTIVEGFSSDATLTTLKNQDLVWEIRHSEEPWSDCMQRAYLEMKKEGIPLEALKVKIDELKMNEKWPELMEFIRKHSDIIRMIILSGSTNLYLGWFLEKRNYTDIIKTFYALPTELDDELFIKIGNIDHHCKSCKADQCKRQNIEDYFNKHPESHYDKVFYFGDGKNDLCGAQWLREQDILFPRVDWPLHKLLIENPNSVKCKFVPWRTGEDIMNVLKECI